MCSLLFQSVSPCLPEWLVGLGTGTKKAMKDKIVNVHKIVNQASDKTLLEFSFSSLQTEEIKEIRLLSETVSHLQRGSWEYIYLN